MKEIDVRQLTCPGPVLELKRLLEAGEPAIRLHVADELARSNVSRFAAARGARVESTPARGSGFLVTVLGDDTTAAAGEEELTCAVPAPEAGSSRGPFVLQITSDAMGQGEEDLGRLLLRSFIKTQLQLEGRPDLILFYNSGVRLCCEGSPLLEDLAALEQQGTELLACGTCLNYLQLAPSLAVGRVTDMLEIASRLSAAGRIVRP